MLTQKFQPILVLLLILLLSFNCTKKNEDQQQTIKDEEYSIASGIEGQSQKVIINYDSLLTELGQLTEMVAANPTDIELRKKLVSTCYDTVYHIITSSGRGTPLTNARTPNLAMKYAERAAIEAYRLAAQLKRWQLDPTTPSLEKLAVANISGRIVSKRILPDSTVQVLVEVHVTNLP